MDTTPNPPVDARLKWVTAASHLLDNQFRLPGTKFRFGLDPLMGLVPIVGDLGSFAISGALVMTMARHGASRHVILRMLFNIFLDAIIGIIPVIGWIFDFTYKANQRNVELLQHHYQEGKYQGKGTGFVIAALLGFLVIFAAMIYGIWKLAEYLWFWSASAW